MPKGSSKEPKKKREDAAQAAVRVIGAVAAHSEEEAPVEITPEMRAAAAAFGRIGGKIGGPARAAKLSPQKRSEIAKKAAAARWKLHGQLRPLPANG
jgi:hypothetical protein